VGGGGLVVEGKEGDGTTGELEAGEGEGEPDPEPRGALADSWSCRGSSEK